MVSTLPETPVISPGQNPFTVAKADNFGRDEIVRLWAEPPNAWADILPSGTSTARILVGGKGCGRTHIMRYHAITSLEDAGRPNTPSLAFWIPLSGLTASKYSGKGWDALSWTRVFGYALELYVAQHVLHAILEADLPVAESVLARAVFSALQLESRRRPTTLRGLSRLLMALQVEVSSATNRVPIDPNAVIQIRAEPGHLVMALANGLRSANPNWREARILYMFDEFELIPTELQTYLQSLLRESTVVATVIIGSRHHGLRTYRTLTGEENRVGSEFTRIELDRINAERPRVYRRFAKLLIVRRLAPTHMPALVARGTDDKQLDWLHAKLQPMPRLSPLAPASQFTFLSDESRSRPYFGRLMTQLRDSGHSSVADAVFALLCAPQHPLLEKANILLFYRAWSSSPEPNLLDAAEEFQADSSRVIPRTHPMPGDRSEVFDKYLEDLTAQLYRDGGRTLPYAGLDTFIDMSEGHPRNLLNLFSHTFDAALFRDEVPFGPNAISIDTQTRGAKAASDWFIDDVVGPGDDARAVTRFLDNLGNLMRELRFSDKPYESSCSAFSVDLGACGDETRRVLDLATGWSLLVPLPHKDKNSKRIITKFQISGMIAPRWDLPIHRRGTLSLLPGNVDAMCSRDGDSEYAELRRSRLSGVRAPFHGRPARREASEESDVFQTRLF